MRRNYAAAALGGFAVAALMGARGHDPAASRLTIEGRSGGQVILTLTDGGKSQRLVVKSTDGDLVHLVESWGEMVATRIELQMPHDGSRPTKTIAGVDVVDSKPAPGKAQGDQEPVTNADVTAMKLNHYFTEDKKFHEPDFEWTFTKDEFVLKAGDGKIPVYLLETLLSEGQTANEIQGLWKLENKDGDRLVLTSIKADGLAGKPRASLPIYRTGPTVVRVGEIQHVFAVTP